MARLPGSVQGVVVQITIEASLTAVMMAAADESLDDKSSACATGNFTHTVSLV